MAADGGAILLELRGIARPGLEPVSLNLAAGSSCVIMGPSGAGKSLLLRAVADLDPHQGEAYLCGTACSAMPAPLWRRRVTYVPAEPGWWDDHVAAHMAKPEPAATLARRLDLPDDVMTAAIARLSTGERLRLALIRALVQEPEVLLLDEPTGALDAAAGDKVADLLVEKRDQGLGLVIVTHDEAFGRRLAGQVRLMDGGHLGEAAP
jgi:UDP-glucose/iron transport system ATP-binding protein